MSSHPIVRNIANILMSFDNVVTLKEWMSNGHAKTRDTMQQCIAHLIGQRREYATEEWMAKLSEVAKRVELRLYSSAESYEEYNDPNTLAERLQVKMFNFILLISLVFNTLVLQKCILNVMFYDFYIIYIEFGSNLGS